MGHLWLIGMMGSGKTVVGTLVARRRSIPFYDIDEIVANDAGMAIRSIFEILGEEEFRARESRAVLELATAPDGIVATGGGVVLDPANTEAMRAEGMTMLLDVDVDLLRQRLGDGAERPLLMERGDGAIEAIATDRAALYRSAADVVVDGRGTIEETAKEVEVAWRRS